MCTVLVNVSSDGSEDNSANYRSKDTSYSHPWSGGPLPRAGVGAVGDIAPVYGDNPLQSSLVVMDLLYNRPPIIMDFTKSQI